MSIVRGFAPIAARHARLLILGSMPGNASLAANEYYAHGQNSFWPIMGSLLGFDPAIPYAARIRALKAAGIALWDVLNSCERKSSLDSDIRTESIVANDFVGFFASHPHIREVLFNGSLADARFRRDVLPYLDHLSLTMSRLPSTSPANARVSRSRKLDAWRTAFEERGIITITGKEHA